jgi:hypothetical protein
MAKHWAKYGIKDPNFQNLRPSTAPGESPEEKARLDKLWESSGAYAENIMAEQASQAGRTGQSGFAVAGPGSESIKAKFEEGQKSYLAGLPAPTATPFVRPEAWDMTKYNVSQYDPGVLEQIQTMFEFSSPEAAAGFAERVLNLKPGMPMPRGTREEVMGQLGFGPSGAGVSTAMAEDLPATTQPGTGMGKIQMPLPVPGTKEGIAAGDVSSKLITDTMNEQGMSFAEAEIFLGLREKPIDMPEPESYWSSNYQPVPGEDTGPLQSTQEAYDTAYTEPDDVGTYIPTAQELEEALGNYDLDEEDFNWVIKTWATSLKDKKYGKADTPFTDPSRGISFSSASDPHRPSYFNTIRNHPNRYQPNLNTDLVNLPPSSRPGYSEPPGYGSTGMPSSPISGRRNPYEQSWGRGGI